MPIARSLGPRGDVPVAASLSLRLSRSYALAAASSNMN